MTADDLHPASRFEWERLLRRSRLSPSTKHVGAVLAQYANRDGSRCRPGTERLANMTGLTGKSVCKALRQLRDAGMVVRVFEGGKAGARRGWADEYRLTLPEDWLDVLQAWGPDERTPVLSTAGQPPDHRNSVPQVEARPPELGDHENPRPPVLGDPTTGTERPRPPVLSTNHQGSTTEHQPVNSHHPAASAADALRARDDDCPHGDPRGPTGCAHCRQAKARHDAVAEAALAEWDREHAH